MTDQFKSVTKASGSPPHFSTHVCLTRAFDAFSARSNGKSMWKTGAINPQTLASEDGRQAIRRSHTICRSMTLMSLVTFKAIPARF
jgi:hypothetical protein